MMPESSNGDMTLMPGEIKFLRSFSKPGDSTYINIDNLEDDNPLLQRCYNEGLIEFAEDDHARQITKDSGKTKGDAPKGTYKKVLLTEHGKIVVNYATERGNTKPVHLSDIFCQ